MTTLLTQTTVQTPSPLVSFGIIGGFILGVGILWFTTTTPGLNAEAAARQHYLTQDVERYGSPINFDPNAITSNRVSDVGLQDLYQLQEIIIQRLSPVLDTVSDTVSDTESTISHITSLIEDTNTLPFEFFGLDMDSANIHLDHAGILIDHIVVYNASNGFLTLINN